jgi:uncharacterized protein
MVICISPAKTFSKTHVEPKTVPIFEKDATSFVKKLKKVSVSDLMKQMHVSEMIAQDVHDFYATFGKIKSAAIYLYDGQAFKGLDPKSLDPSSIKRIEAQLYILSGLYGLIRPMDGISMYRLEMQSRIIGHLENHWKNKIQQYFRTNHPNDVIINLASEEYGKLLLGLENVHTIEFIITRDGKQVQNNMAIKKIRGMMARHLIMSNIKTLDEMQSIEIDGFIYQKRDSSPKKSVFRKDITKNVT